jgi:alpha-tubulin suppressor-like RCC1 family protein
MRVATISLLACVGIACGGKLPPTSIHDAGSPSLDSGAADASVDDAGLDGGGQGDAALSDGPIGDGAVLPDAGLHDAGLDDSGPADSGLTDSGPIDSGPPPCTLCVEPIQTAAMGALHTCALGVQGRTACWGQNDYGQLTGPEQQVFPHPQLLDTLESLADLSAGDYHNCGIRRSDRSLVCWGRNDHSQLGDGTQVDRQIPQVLPNTAQTDGVVAGRAHTCAWAAGGLFVSCWGRGQEGQLGDGLARDSAAQVLVQLPRVSGLAVAYTHTCAVLDTGGVRCWGANDKGQLGNGSQLTKIRPHPVNDMSNAVQVSATWDHTCVVTNDNEVWCWGWSADGQVGSGLTESVLVPTRVTNASGAIEVAAGGQHTCVRKLDGQVLCWGANAAGQLGNGTRTSSTHPVVVNTRRSAVSLRAGYHHNCMITVEAEMKCWGYNEYGQLGDDTLSDRSVPVPVFEL